MTTRRTLLTAIGLSPLAALPAVAAVSPEDRVERAVKELHDAMAAMHGGHWGTMVSHDTGLALVSSTSGHAGPPNHSRFSKGARTEWQGTL